jgi:hypothetical protein
MTIKRCRQEGAMRSGFSYCHKTVVVVVVVNLTMGDIARMVDAARYARGVIEQNDPPQGVVDGRGRDFEIQMAYSQAVKYVARHVSRELPPNIYRNETPCPTREVLKLELGGLERGRLPPLFGSMLDCLLLDEQLELSPVLYQAAFATELHGRLVFVQMMNYRPGFRQGIVYDLLVGSGFVVW